MVAMNAGLISVHDGTDPLGDPSFAMPEGLQEQQHEQQH